LSGLQTDDVSDINSKINKHNASHLSLEIVYFNYTSTLDSLISGVRDLQVNGRFCSANSSGGRLGDSLDGHIHVHCTLNEAMIVGADNSDQVGVHTFSQDNQRYVFKSQAMRVGKHSHGLSEESTFSGLYYCYLWYVNGRD
jgi:hypothetical protein